MSDTTGRRPALPPYWEAYIQQTKARHRQVEDALSARIEELEAKADHAWSMVAKGDADVIRAAAHAATLEAKLVKAMAGLEKSKHEIDLYIQFEYPSDHPVHEKYRQRDFSENPARPVIAEIKGENT